MNKHLKTLGTSLAALAAAAILSSPTAAAQAQLYKAPQANELAGAPGSVQQDWRGPPSGDDRRYEDDRRYDDDDWRGGDRRRGPDFQTAQAECSRAAIQEAWRNRAYSAQYDGAPRLVEGRRGWELVGRVRVHSRKGYTSGDTVCQLRGNEAVRFDYLR